MRSFKFKDDFMEDIQKMAFCSLRYSYVGTENTLDVNQCGSESGTLLLSLQICGFAICGLGHQGNLGINHYKFADLLFAEGTSQKFADLQLRNEPTNLRICDLRTTK
jgi:hypothetical protein